jgi:hypothetical protein
MAPRNFSGVERLFPESGTFGAGKVFPTRSLASQDARNPGAEILLLPPSLIRPGALRDGLYPRPGPLSAPGRFYLSQPLRRK